jgi:hypothetical protein
MASLRSDLVPVCSQGRSGPGFGVVGLVARGREAGPVASPWGTHLRSCLCLPLGFAFARPGSAVHLMNKEQLQGGQNYVCNGVTYRVRLVSEQACSVAVFHMRLNTSTALRTQSGTCHHMCKNTR